MGGRKFNKKRRFCNNKHIYCLAKYNKHEETDMYWKSKDLRKEQKIRERIHYHRMMLAKKTAELSKLYDKVHKAQLST